MRVGSLFSGIGGFDLGFERAGMSMTWQAETEPFASAVLRKHWPNIPNHGDVRGIQADTVQPVDVLCGGWPCQTWSTASRGRSTHPDMWPEVLRLTKALKPRWLVVENVPRALHGIDRMASDLADDDYAVGIVDCDVALPERQRGRMRGIIVAHSNSNGEPLVPVYDQVASICRFAKSVSETIPGFMGMADGIPGRMDRLRVLGNAIPPQIAEAIGRAIMTVEVSQ